MALTPSDMSQSANLDGIPVRYSLPGLRGAQLRNSFREQGIFVGDLHRSPGFRHSIPFCLTPCILRNDAPIVTTFLV